MDLDGTAGVFTFTVKNNSDAPLHMATPNESFVVKVLDKDGNSKWSNYFNLSIRGCSGGRTARFLIFSPSSRPDCG